MGLKLDRLIKRAVVDNKVTRAEVALIAAEVKSKGKVSKEEARQLEAFLDKNTSNFEPEARTALDALLGDGPRPPPPSPGGVLSKPLPLTAVREAVRAWARAQIMISDMGLAPPRRLQPPGGPYYYTLTPADLTNPKVKIPAGLKPYLKAIMDGPEHSLGHGISFGPSAGSAGGGQITVTDGDSLADLVVARFETDLKAANTNKGHPFSGAKEIDSEELKAMRLPGGLSAAELVRWAQHGPELSAAAELNNYMIPQAKAQVRAKPDQNNAVAYVKRASVDASGALKFALEPGAPKEVMVRGQKVGIEDAIWEELRRRRPDVQQPGKSKDDGIWAVR